MGFVEYSVKHEHSLSPNKPIYLVGDSFGCCLALAVASRNPIIDLVLILVNPGLSKYKKNLIVDIVNCLFVVALIWCSLHLTN